MNTSLAFWLTRVPAYGALPAFAYLVLITAIGSASQAMLFPVFYIWIVAGLLITGWVAKRRARRE